MDLHAPMRAALCNCFGQADAFMNTFLEKGSVTRKLSKRNAAIKVKLTTDCGDFVAGHAFVCVLEDKTIRICQAFYDDNVPFQITHTLSEDDTLCVLCAIKTPTKTSIATFARIIPQLQAIFEPDDVITIDIERISWD